MTRRIDIELTSDRGDGSWTWRAAGAKLPKGSLDASLLYDGASVGDVVRADADFALDGVYIDAVLPPKGRSGRPEAQRLEFAPSSFEGGVTTTWKERKGGDRDGRSKGRSRDGGRERGGRDGERGADRPNREGGRGADRPNRDGGREGGRYGERPNRGERSERSPRSGERNDRGPRRDDRPERPKPKRLRPGRAHRSAWIESLPVEQRIVAEQLSRGGIQAVRAEIDAQNEKAKADGTSPIDGSALLTLAEGMMPRLRDAEWRDRAEAALADVNEIDLRDLRSVVAAESARDNDGRALAERLRTALNERVERAQAEWVEEVTSTLAEGRVVRALRVSSRSPKAGAQLPPDVLKRLIDATNSSIDANTTQQRLATVLDAVSRSVVRPHFVLETIPAEPTEELLEAVKKVASQLPEIAARFGVSASRRPRKPKPAGDKPIPPKPAAAEANAPLQAPAAEAELAADVVTEAPAETVADSVAEETVAEETVAEEAVAEEAVAEETVAEETVAETSSGEPTDD